MIFFTWFSQSMISFLCVAIICFFVLLLHLFIGYIYLFLLRSFILIWHWWNGFSRHRHFRFSKKRMSYFKPLALEALSKYKMYVWVSISVCAYTFSLFYCIFNKFDIDLCQEKYYCHEMTSNIFIQKIPFFVLVLKSETKNTWPIFCCHFQIIF